MVGVFKVCREGTTEVRVNDTKFNMHAEEAAEAAVAAYDK